MNRIEDLAVVICVSASVMVSFFAAETNFAILFSLFLVSALILSVTTYLKKNFPIMRLQMFFVLINTFALTKILLS